MRIADFIGGSNPWTDGRMRVEGLAQRPLRSSKLPAALGDVVSHAIAEHILGRTLHRNMLAPPADDGHQFHLIIDLGRAGGDQNGIERPVDRGLRLSEPDLLGGQFEIRFRRVVRVVQTDGKNLAWPCNRCGQADRWQRSRCAHPSVRGQLILILGPLFNQFRHGTGKAAVDDLIAFDQSDPQAVIDESCKLHDLLPRTAANPGCEEPHCEASDWSKLARPGGSSAVSKSPSVQCSSSWPQGSCQ